MHKLRWIMAILALGSVLSAFAQNNKDWEPTGVWPFINQQFRTATVYVGVFHQSKTVVPCNIHVGNHTLWYSKNDTLMEADPGSVVRVEFPNGDIYMPVGSDQRFGRIVREDWIDGSVARIICVKTVNQKELDQKYFNHLNKTINIFGGPFNMSDIASSEGGIILEEQPLPMVNEFYFQLRGEIFQATRQRILSHIDPARKQEYRKFTRSAEIISTNESSMLKVWEEFFLK